MTRDRTTTCVFHFLIEGIPLIVLSFQWLVCCTTHVVGYVADVIGHLETVVSITTDGDVYAVHVTYYLNTTFHYKLITVRGDSIQ